MYPSNQSWDLRGKSRDSLGSSSDGCKVGDITADLTSMLVPSWAICHSVTQDRDAPGVSYSVSKSAAADKTMARTQMQTRLKKGQRRPSVHARGRRLMRSAGELLVLRPGRDSLSSAAKLLAASPLLPTQLWRGWRRKKTKKSRPHRLIFCG